MFTHEPTKYILKYQKIQTVQKRACQQDMRPLNYEIQLR